jgi:hypothetical protein
MTMRSYMLLLRNLFVNLCKNVFFKKKTNFRSELLLQKNIVCIYQANIYFLLIKWQY